MNKQIEFHSNKMVTYRQLHTLQLLLIGHFHVQDDLPKNNNRNVFSQYVYNIPWLFFV